VNRYTLPVDGGCAYVVNAASLTGARLLLEALTGQWDESRVNTTEITPIATSVICGVAEGTHCPILGCALSGLLRVYISDTWVSPLGACLLQQHRLANPARTVWDGYIGHCDVRTFDGGLLATVVRETATKLPFGRKWSHMSGTEFFVYTARTPDGRVWRGKCGGVGLVCTFRLVKRKAA
jgi:hypothetical protein